MIQEKILHSRGPQIPVKFLRSEEALLQSDKASKLGLLQNITRKEKSILNGVPLGAVLPGAILPAPLCSLL